MDDLRITAATHERVEDVLDHWERYDAQSGREGDLPYGPQADEPPSPRATVRERLDAAFRIRVGRPDWMRVWIAHRGERAIGHITLRWQPPGGGAHRAWCSIGVERAHRGQGVGRRLLGAAIEWATAHPDLDWIDLGVFAENTRAIALYRSEGFVPTGRVEDRFRVAGRSIDDITMARPVGPIPANAARPWPVRAADPGAPPPAG